MERTVATIEEVGSPIQFGRFHSGFFAFRGVVGRKNRGGGVRTYGQEKSIFDGMGELLLERDILWIQPCRLILNTDANDCRLSPGGATMKYGQEIEEAAKVMESLIVSHFKDTADPPATVDVFHSALVTLKRAAQDSARWAGRMMLLEKRIRAAQDIFDGAGSVSLEEEKGEPASLAVLLRPSQARALVQEMRGKTVTFAKHALDDIARALEKNG